MGDFLNSDSTYAKTANTILALAAIGGIVFIGAVAPNIVQLLKFHRRKTNYSKKQVTNTIMNLNKHGFIKVLRQKNGKTEILLTNKGKKRIHTFCLQRLTLEKPQKWDKKWRVVVFDVPVTHNQARTALRRKLIELGFYQLQRSVWVYPYACEDELLFVAHVFGIENCLNIFTTQRVLHEEKLKKIFKLQ